MKVKPVVRHPFRRPNGSRKPRSEGKRRPLHPAGAAYNQLVNAASEGVTTVAERHRRAVTRQIIVYQGIMSIFARLLVPRRERVSPPQTPHYKAINH